MFFAFKTIISALVIVLVGELSKRSSTLAALLLALPLVSVIAFCWQHIETSNTVKIAEISSKTFWYVLPTLPMFLLLSYLLKHEVNFYIAMLLCCLVTAALFAATQFLLAKFS